MWAQEVLERERWCPRCRRYVLARQKQFPNKVWAAFLVLSCFLLLPLAFLHVIWFGLFEAGYLCPRCGKRMR